MSCCGWSTSTGRARLGGTVDAPTLRRLACDTEIARVVLDRPERYSTSAAPPGCPGSPNTARSPPAITAACSPAATGHLAGARPPTAGTESTADPPAWPTSLLASTSPSIGPCGPLHRLRWRLACRLNRGSRPQAALPTRRVSLVAKPSFRMRVVSVIWNLTLRSLLWPLSRPTFAIFPEPFLQLSTGKTG